MICQFRSKGEKIAECLGEDCPFFENGKCQRVAAPDQKKEAKDD